MGWGYDTFLPLPLQRVAVILDRKDHRRRDTCAFYQRSERLFYAVMRGGSTSLQGAVERHSLHWRASSAPSRCRDLIHRSVYWRATPTDFSPFFKKPVSSTMSTPLFSSPRCSTTYLLRSSRTASASQRAAFKRRCAPCGPCSPISSAICQPFLRSTLLRRPAR